MNTRSTIVRSVTTTHALPAVLCTLLAMSNTAGAEGLYILGSFGQSRFHDDSKSDKDYAAGHQLFVPLTSSSQDENDSAYKLTVGYMVGRNFAVEGGYVDLGKQAYRPRSDVGPYHLNAEVETSVKGWGIDAVLILPVNAGFSLFFKGGVAEIKVEQDIDTNFGLKDSSSSSRVKPKAGLGLSYDLPQGVSVRAEYERFFDVGDTDGGVDIYVDADVDLLSLGLSYRF